MLEDSSTFQLLESSSSINSRYRRIALSTTTKQPQHPIATMQKLLALLLALAATVHCQSAIIPNSAPPEPSGGAPPSGGAQPSGGAEPVGGVPPGAPLVTIGGNTIAAGLDGAYDLGKQTLERGSAITNQGTVYSLAPGGMFLVADGKTSTIREGAGGRLPIFSMNAMSSAAAMGTGGFGVGISSSSYSFGPSASSAAMTGSGSASVSQPRSTTAAEASSAVSAGASASSSAPANGNGVPGSAGSCTKGSVLGGILAGFIGLGVW